MEIRALGSFQFDVVHTWSTDEVMMLTAPAGHAGHIVVWCEPRRPDETPSEHAKRRLQEASTAAEGEAPSVEVLFLGTTPAWRACVPSRAGEKQLLYVAAPDGKRMVVVRSEPGDPAATRAIATLEFTFADPIRQHRATRGRADEPFPEIPIPYGRGRDR